MNTKMISKSTWLTLALVVAAFALTSDVSAATFIRQVPAAPQTTGSCCDFAEATGAAALDTAFGEPAKQQEAGAAVAGNDDAQLAAPEERAGCCDLAPAPAPEPNAIGKQAVTAEKLGVSSASQVIGANGAAAKADTSPELAAINAYGLSVEYGAGDDGKSSIAPQALSKIAEAPGQVPTARIAGAQAVNDSPNAADLVAGEKDVQAMRDCNAVQDQAVEVAKKAILAA